MTRLLVRLLVASILSAAALHTSGLHQAMAQGVQASRKDTRATAPIRIELFIDEAVLDVHVDVPFTAIASPLVDMGHMVGKAEVFGPISLGHVSTLDWKNIRANDTITAHGTIRIEREGEGELRVAVGSVGRFPDTVYGVSASIYFHNSGKRLLMNTHSRLDLALQRLRIQRKAGEISRGQYEKEMQELLRGLKRDSVRTREKQK